MQKLKGTVKEFSKVILDVPHHLVLPVILILAILFFVYLLILAILMGSLLWFYFYFLFFKIYFIYLFIYFGCVGSSFLCEGFLQLRQAGATLHRGVWASRYRGLSCCGAQAPDAQAQQLWLMGSVGTRHVGSSQTRARTRVPCIGRQILNNCATREAPIFIFLMTKDVEHF